MAWAGDKWICSWHTVHCGEWQWLSTVLFVCECAFCLQQQSQLQLNYWLHQTRVEVGWNLTWQHGGFCLQLLWLVGPVLLYKTYHRGNRLLRFKCHMCYGSPKRTNSAVDAANNAQKQHRDNRLRKRLWQHIAAMNVHLTVGNVGNIF